MALPDATPEQLFVLDIMAALVENYELRTDNILLYSIRADLMELKSPSPDPNLYSLGLDCAINHIDLMIKQRASLLQQLKQGASLQDDLPSAKKVQVEEQIKAFADKYPQGLEYLDEIICELHETRASCINSMGVYEQVRWLHQEYGDSVADIEMELQAKEVEDAQ